MTGRWWTWTLLLALAPLGSACAEIIDLEPASVDRPAGDAPSELGAGGAAGQTTSSTVGGAGGEGQGNGGGGSGAGGAAPSVCDAYCDSVMESCAGSFAVYSTREVCQATCAQLPEGEAGDTEGNSVRCRLHHAERASAEPSFYCPAASIAGNGVCGSSCEALCGVSRAVCSGADAVWASDAACEEECGALPDLGTYSVDPEQAMYAGPHVQCRLFHLSAAAAADPEAHCGHVGGAEPCVPPAGDAGGP